MISILIPVYNFDVRNLVAELHRQCEDAGITFEIICYDDASDSGYLQTNAGLDKMERVRYHLLSQNLGRARIRNALANAAQYRYLLFMDCDSGIVSDHYIRQYVDHLQPGLVLYGGRVYNEEPPSDLQLTFHWLYGRNREQVPAVLRRKNPYHSFMTNNFVIPRDIFLSVKFDERLTQYGHEDTIFGMELRRRNIPILHLDNPLEHLGLERAGVFLEKTRKAIENLYFLSKTNQLIETKLLSTFGKLKSRGLILPVFLVLNMAAPLLRSQLLSGHPRLFLFDLYKLFLLLKEDSRRHS